MAIRVLVSEVRHEDNGIYERDWCTENDEVNDGRNDPRPPIRHKPTQRIDWARGRYETGLGQMPRRKWLPRNRSRALVPRNHFVGVLPWTLSRAFVLGTLRVLINEIFSRNR